MTAELMISLAADVVVLGVFGFALWRVRSDALYDTRVSRRESLESARLANEARVFAESVSRRVDGLAGRVDVLDHEVAEHGSSWRPQEPAPVKKAAVKKAAVKKATAANKNPRQRPVS